MLDTNNQLWPSVKSFVMIKHREARQIQQTIMAVLMAQLFQPTISYCFVFVGLFPGRQSSKTVTNGRRLCGVKCVCANVAYGLLMNTYFT